MEERLKSKLQHTYDKYVYIINNTIWVKILYGFGIVSWTFLLYGYSKFLNLSPLYWATFGVIIAIITIYNYLNFGINLFYPHFDLKKHNKARDSYWKNLKQKPSIDVFLPVCGEDVKLLEQTFSAVHALRYANKKVYVLDDKGSKVVKKLASQYDFSYLSRPDKGYMKKAGNLKYGFEHSKGEYYIVFDADFAPNPDFISELLPYMDDPRIGIVQSPQYFEINKNIHDRSPIEYGSANIQEDFYRIIQPSRDVFGGAICVGSNAIYRRSALEKIGGPTQVDHGEDVHTGVDIVSAGYKVKYIPLVLALGLCPDTLQSFYKQHNRWCSSSTGMFLSGKVWKANMTFQQKTCYYTGFLYYITQLFHFVLPIQLFVLLSAHSESINIIKALPFVPYIIFGLFILPMSRKSKPKIGTYLAVMSTVYTHSFTVIMRFFGRAATWVPTNSLEHGIEKGFEFLNNFSIFFIGIYIIAMAALIYTWNLPIFNWAYYSVIFWLIWNMVLHLLYYSKTYVTIYEKKFANAINNSQYLNEFKIWRGKSIAIIVVVIGVMIGSSGYAIKATDSQMLYASRPVILANQKRIAEEKMLALNNEKSIENTINNQNEVVLGSTTDKAKLVGKNYKIVAMRNDSVYKMARKAINNYIEETGIVLDPTEKVYVESYLSRSLKGTSIKVGNELSFSFNQIDSIAINSQRMSSQARNAWKRYVSKINFEAN